MKTTPALWAAEAEKAAAVETPTFVDRLDAAGFSPEDVAGLEPLIEAEASERAVGLAVDFVRELALRLRTESAAGAALSVVLSPGPSCEELAAKLGISKQAVGVVVSRLRASLPDVRPSSARPRWSRPDISGEWLTRPEARAKYGLSADSLRRLRARSLRCGTRIFVEAGDVEARLAHGTVEAARRRLG